jgi:hypothetical protein
MQSRFLLCGMAAAPDPSGTRFGFLGVIRMPGQNGDICLA